MLEMSVQSLDEWTKSLDALSASVTKEYRRLRKDGVTRMSRGNLRQIVSTKGVSVPPAKFDRLLDQAIERADVPSGFFS